ncbi:MAG: hypothetical protein H0X15_01700 [Acidobacteria bacterium]|jgi:hypothetical protein|nr:hypothetical protein [Acidobacteriota bacterium]MBA4122688.1 hypothetical protein [Acidobacteriota bacterium]
MKWLILLGLLIILVIIIAARYRRQIQMAIYVLRMFRKMRAGKTDERQIETKESAKDVPLIRCGKCGTWIPQNKALSLRSGVFYCSTNCLENTKAETRPLGRV